MQTSNTSERVRATDLVATLAQALSDLKLEPRTRIPLTEENLEETIEEKTEEKILIHTSHLLAPELDLAVALLATDDVPELLQLETGEICFQAVHDHQLADSLLEGTTDLAPHHVADHVHPMGVVEPLMLSDPGTTHPIHETQSVNELLLRTEATTGHDLLPDEPTHHLAMPEEEATDQGLVHPQERQPTKMTTGDHVPHPHDQTPATRHEDHHLLSIQIARA